MIVLDTHVLIWHEHGDRRLGPRARQAFENALKTGGAAVSAISFWEVGMQIRKGRLRFRIDPDTWRRDLRSQGLVEIAVDGGIASRAGLIADMHGDPVDRIIVATALEGHQLVTADRQILDWPGPLNRLPATH